MNAPRVAYFPDSFHEVNGVAHTSRNFVAYAQRHDLPFLCIRAAGAEHVLPPGCTGDLRTLDLPRSRASIAMEKDLQFDPFFWRYARRISRALDEFRPDLIHITGPSELGIFGAIFARARGLPLAASWHTNVHEYAARRASYITRLLPGNVGATAERQIEAAALWASSSFYRMARVLFAPNEELCSLLHGKTGLPCHLMQRGVDTELFSPSKRSRGADGEIVLGYVGRLSVEKNVALLPRIEAELRDAGFNNVRFLIVGHGSEEASLRSSLRQAEFAGVLRGEDLARAYANMDLLAFPSHTDTFGNVVLEALASGVPAVVTPDGGPRFIVRQGETGFVASDSAFAPTVAALLRDPLRLGPMRAAARAYALGCSWDAVFDRVYAAYDSILPGSRRP